MDNRIFVSGDVTAIEVYHKGSGRYFYVLVNTEDLNFITGNAKTLSISISRYTNYCFLNTFDNKLKNLHRFIMHTPKDLVVDHINHNGLDNRKTNLRNVTRSVNSKNRIEGNKNYMSWYRSWYKEGRFSN